MLRKIWNQLSTVPRRVMALVAAVGAVLGVIGGVKALLPPPGETLEARFGSVTAYPEISLEQYDASAGSGGLVRGSPTPAKTGAVTYLLAADTTTPSTTSTAPTHVTPSTPATGSTRTLSAPVAPVNTTSLSTTIAIEKLREASTERKYPSRVGGTIPTTTLAVPYPQERSVRAATSAATPPRQSFHQVAGALVTEGTGAPKSKVAAVLGALSSAMGNQLILPAFSKSCLSQCGENQEIAYALTYDPNPVKAAEAVAALFSDSRGEIVDRRLYPIGAMVNYTLNLDGFAHRKVALEWSLLDTASGRALPRPWWRDVVASHIEPTVNHESLSGTFWVPVPPKRGDYRVHLVLLDATKGVPYTSEDSTDFH